jgi:IS1 family transposase
VFRMVSLRTRENCVVRATDVLERDELESFVAEKFFKRWLWLAMCRRTRQIVAYAIGDRSETTAQKLWQARCLSCLPDDADEYNVYPLIIPREQYRPAPKRCHLTNQRQHFA